MPCFDAVRNLIAAACVCVLANVGCPQPASAGTHLLPSGSAPASTSTNGRQTFSARISLPYGGQVQRATAELAARTLARLEVLRQAETVIAALTAVRLGLDSPCRLAALTSLVLPPLVATLPNDGHAAVTVQADVFVPEASLPDTVQAALARPDDLELQASALSRATALVKEAQELINQAQTRREQGQPDDLFAARLVSLETHLRAAEQYMVLLDRYGSGWFPPEEASEALRAALQRDPGNALINLGLAESLLRLDRPHEAIRFASEALRLEPTLGRALYVRGLAQLRVRLSALAVADFTQALAARPDKAAWWSARGAAYLVRHEYDLMCADLYQACTLGDCEGLAEVRAQALCTGDGEDVASGSGIQPVSGEKSDCQDDGRD